MPRKRLFGAVQSIVCRLPVPQGRGRARETYDRTNGETEPESGARDGQDGLERHQAVAPGRFGTTQASLASRDGAPGKRRDSGDGPGDAKRRASRGVATDLHLSVQAITSGRSRPDAYREQGKATMTQNIATQPLRQGRVWVDFGKLVLAAVVQGVAVSAVVALVVVFLAGGSAGDAPDSSGAAVSGAPPRAASLDREQG